MSAQDLRAWLDRAPGSAAPSERAAGLSQSTRLPPPQPVDTVERLRREAMTVPLLAPNPDAPTGPPPTFEHTFLQWLEKRALEHPQPRAPGRPADASERDAPEARPQAAEAPDAAIDALRSSIAEVTAPPAGPSVELRS